MRSITVIFFAVFVSFSSFAKDETRWTKSAIHCFGHLYDKEAKIQKDFASIYSPAWGDSKNAFVIDTPTYESRGNKFVTSYDFVRIGSTYLILRVFSDNFDYKDENGMLVLDYVSEREPGKIVSVSNSGKFNSGLDLQINVEGFGLAFKCDVYEGLTAKELRDRTMSKTNN